MKFRAFDPSRALAMLSFAALAVAAAACSTNVTNNPAGPGGSSGSAPVPTADCTSRCEAKATQCGAPAATGKEACGKVCDGSYTSDQLSCLENKPCGELQSASSISSVCPRDSGSSGSSTGTSGSSNTSSGSTSEHYSCSLNGQCFKCADSAGVSKCSLTDGPGPRLHEDGLQLLRVTLAASRETSPC